MLHEFIADPVGSKPKTHDFVIVQMVVSLSLYVIMLFGMQIVSL